MMNPILVNLPEGGRFGSAITQVFSPEIYDSLHREVRKIEWEEAQQYFYRQRERNLAKMPVFQDIFDRKFRSQVASTVGAYFAEVVDEDFDVAAHKMIAGDYIGVHTDENDLGETFRMTVTLNENWKKEDGGILLTLKSGKVTDVDGAWLPSRNNGFIFGISEVSHHAVTPISADKPRYSLIFTFKRAFGRSALNVWNFWYPFPLKSDIDEARYTAGKMNISVKTFDSPYSCYVFGDSRELSAFMDGNLRNAPRGFTYSDSTSRNVDEFGEQPRGTDKQRIEKISKFKRLPPICLVRRHSSEYILVNGSHRLSHAVDSSNPICAIVFDELLE
jgi:2OG-Fe(II) oxygenase superfamily